MTRALLIAVTIAFLLLFLVAPLVVVFTQAFHEGFALYLKAITDETALAAVRLTLTVALIVVPINLVFGLAAAWAIARFAFRGRRLLMTLIDLPFSVSPVIAGMIFVLLFGAHGLLGHTMARHGWKIIFALPGIVLGTLFVTSPLV
ncbi:MAG TPA: sulfate ABC transporter permease subunit CysW, partial [Candidatus Polarisedimenticolia bacterium]|nr:sulfate ABC transporter permease subunit CysW [Candidatus Polarisedimenticolia bacterium]